jgi:hypothetical protein
MRKDTAKGRWPGLYAPLLGPVKQKISGPKATSNRCRCLTFLFVADYHRATQSFALGIDSVLLPLHVKRRDEWLA